MISGAREEVGGSGGGGGGGGGVDVGWDGVLDLDLDLLLLLLLLHLPLLQDLKKQMLPIARNTHHSSRLLQTNPTPPLKYS